MNVLEVVMYCVFFCCLGAYAVYTFLTRRKQEQDYLDMFCSMQKIYHLLLEQAISERDRAILDCQAARLDRDRAILEHNVTRAQLRACSEQLRVYDHALRAEKDESAPSSY